MSTFSSSNITDGNLVLKERTHRIKIKYSVHQYSIRLHNLGNWLMTTTLNVSVQPSVYTTKQKSSNTIDVTTNKQFIYCQCWFETTRPARDDNLLSCSTIFQSYFSSKFYIHLLGLPYVRLKAVDSCMSTLYRVGLLQHRCIITMINNEVTLCLLQKKQNAEIQARLSVQQIYMVLMKNFSLAVATCENRNFSVCFSSCLSL